MQDEGRDRMMVLVFELSEQQLSFWDLLHTDAIKLLDQLELSGEPGVCVRYYHQVERSPMIEVVQGSHNTRPVAGSSIARQPDESMDTWLQRRMRSPDFPEALRERAEEMIQRRNEGDHGANEQRVTMSEAARSLSSMMSFEEQMGLIARTPTPLGLQTSAYNMANISAERSTTIRRLTTSRRPLFERMPSAYRRRSTPNTGSGITGTRNAIVDYYNSMSDPFQSSAGVDDEEDGAPFSDPDDGTDVSVLRIAVSDKEEESLLPRFPGPALEYR